jgi:hypothetical protein
LANIKLATGGSPDQVLIFSIDCRVGMILDEKVPSHERIIAGLKRKIVVLVSLHNSRPKMWVSPGLFA